MRAARPGLGLLLGFVQALPGLAAAQAPIPGDSVVLSMAPGDLSVVEIRAPDRGDGSSVVWETFPHSPFTLVGADSGSSAPGAPILLTIRAPDGTRAGSRDAMTILFDEGAASSVLVRVDVDVRSGVAIVLDSALVHAHPGGRVDVGFTIINGTNADEVLLLRAATVSDWSAEWPPGSTSFALAPGETRRGFVTLRAPPSFRPGRQRITLGVEGAEGEPRAEAVIPVELRGGAEDTGGEVPGLLLTPAFTLFGEPSSPGPPLVELEASGRLVGARVRGRWTGSAREGGSARGLADVGTPWGPDFLELMWPGLRIVAGGARMDLSPLAGAQVFGRGVRLERWGDRMRATAFGGGPEDTSRRRGRYAGLQMGVRVGSLWLDASAVDLEEASPSPRRLRAVELRAAFPLADRVDVEGGVAHRRTPLGTGLGWDLGAEARTDSGHALLRLRQSPGGFAGFALGSSEWTLAASRRITPRASVEGSFSRVDDGGTGGVGLSSRTWTAGPLLRLGPLQLAARGFGRWFEGSTDRYRIRHADTGGGVEGRVSLADLRLTADARLVHRRRDIGVLAGESAQRGSGWGHEVDAGAAFVRPAATVRASLRRTGPTPGLAGVPGHWWGRFALADVRPLAVRPSLLVGAALEVLVAQGTPGLTRWTARAATPLPGGIRATIQLERVPFATGGGSRLRSWVAALRIERAVSVSPPRAFGSASEGIVFLDDNADGVRDRGEAGLPGVAVSRGSERAVTDRRGVFRLAIGAAGIPVVEQGTLPPYHVPLHGTGGGGSDIPVVDVGRAIVELEGTPDALGRLPAQESQGLRVVLVHEASSRSWTGTPDPSGRTVFPSLPRGRFRVEVRGVGGFEVAEPLPPLVIQGQGVTTRMVIPLVPVPMRFPGSRNPGPGRGGAS